MYEIFVQLLREAGLSAYQFSKRAGIAQSTLSDWKRGVSRPRIDKKKSHAPRRELKALEMAIFQSVPISLNTSASIKFHPGN